MKNGVFWRIRRVAVVRTCFVPNSLILFTLIMEVIRSSETWLLTRTTLRHIKEAFFMPDLYVMELARCLGFTSQVRKLQMLCNFGKQKYSRRLTQVSIELLRGMQEVRVMKVSLVTSF
jgi:hypothetical protein